jgi:membrane protease YdiL (CAAX protease family)
VNLAARVERLVRPALVDRVDRDHRESDAAFRRRRIVVGVTLCVGAALLGLSLTSRPGATPFYVLTFLLASTWTIGGFVSGPLHLGRVPFRGELRRPVVTPIAVGLAIGAVFVVGALVVREIAPLRDYTEHVLAFARRGNLAVVAVVAFVNAVAEEIFFRGALFAAIGIRHPVLVSTVVYALATAATGNPMLVFAAVILGVVVGLERRSSGGILGPMLTHLIWSAILLFALPPLFS